MLLGDLVDAHVDQDHDEAGRKEGANGGVEDVPGVVVQPAVGAALFAHLALVHGEQRREGDDRRNQPHHHDRRLDAARRPLRRVADGPRDGQVAVQADGAQVHDGRGAEEHIQGQVDFAPHGTEVPVTHQLIGQ